MIIAVIILTLLLGISIYINWNLSRKVSILENYASDFLSDLVNLKEKIREANKIIKDADIRGSFESDDEVGSAFRLIRDSINYLDTTTNLNNENE